ncbi:MAG: site-2 protease family protein [Alphaproteobacteria bacterium]
MFLESPIFQSLTKIVILIISVVLHEISHGITALLFGDDTAKKYGRITLNPLSHIDLAGSIILPLLLLLSKMPFLFGWAKPVPVNFNRLYPKRLGIFTVAIAGPFSNFLLAFMALIFLKVFDSPSFINDVLILTFHINLILGTFNLIPILPLDGGRIAGAILPSFLEKLFSKLEIYGFFIIFLLIIAPSIGSIVGIKLDPLRWILLPLINYISKILFYLSGY